MLTHEDFEGLIGPILLKNYPDRTLMGAEDLKTALSGIPGIDGLTISYKGGNQILHIADKQVEISPMASNEEIRAALQNPFVPTRNTRMSISGYEPGSIKAKLEALKTSGKNRRDAALAKLEDAGKKHEAVSAEIESIAGKIEKEADEAMAEFAQFTNGGPT